MNSVFSVDATVLCQREREGEGERVSVHWGTGVIEMKLQALTFILATFSAFF